MVIVKVKSTGVSLIRHKLQQVVVAITPQEALKILKNTIET